jgi:hypothetical protein
MDRPAGATSETASAWPRSAAIASFGIFLPAVILFCLGAVSNIMVPGLYMDAVNPDYMVVRLLNPGTNVPVWILPGTLLFGLFPVIGQVYHGALPFYLGLPIYALFGTGVVAVRLANLFFGLLVLIATGAFLRTFRVRDSIAGICLAALALDPGFLFCFRTQFYITLLPIAPLLASVALLEHRRLTPTPGIAIAAGFLAGLSVYGYFIYAFLVPAAAVYAAWRWRDQRNRTRLVLWWIAGLALGGSPYVIGMLLILKSTGGLHAFISFLAANLAGLSVSGSTLPLLQRPGYFAQMVWWTVLDVGPSSMMLGTAPRLSLPNARIALLLGVPALGFLVSVIRAPRSPGIFLVAGLIAGLAVLTAVFGNRLWLHHFDCLLPLLTIALALTLDQFMSRFPWRRAVLPAGAAILLLLPLFAANLINRQIVLFELTRTGGVKLASDAIDRFAGDSLQTRAPTHAFFPDWGIFMAFEMITRGHIPLTTGFTPRDAQYTLCSGEDVLLAVMQGQSADKVPSWIGDVGWGQPDIATYRQYDGVPVLTSIRWHAAAPAHPACPP